MTRIGIVSQARMTSTRLPGKVLLEAGGKSMLQHHVDRLRAAGAPIILATTTNDTDEPLVELAADLGIEVFRGSEDDVLSRFAGAAREFELDAVVRVTSDCPLIDSDLVRDGLARYQQLQDSHTYVSNTMSRTFPRGFDFEIFSAELLQEANEHAVDPASREHVTPYINQNRSGSVRVQSITRDDDASDFRVTLDTPDDFLVIRSLIEDFDAANEPVDGIIAILRAHPELAELNRHVEQKELGQ